MYFYSLIFIIIKFSKFMEFNGQKWDYYYFQMEILGVFELIDDEYVFLNMGSNKIKIVNLNIMIVVYIF